MSSDNHDVASQIWWLTLVTRRSVRAWIMRVGLVGVIAAGCAAPSPPPSIGSGDALWIDNRGGPTVIIEINGLRAAVVGCDDGAVVRPGSGGLPPLPWTVRVVAQDRPSEVLLAQQLRALPKWIILFGDSAAVSDSPVLGPPGPPCSSPSQGQSPSTT
ncbi:MAG TPA: hypothetical protein VK592_05670 [Candidatus Dormibacteraeota bacterium]|nr:hypothetical protein [Candidatus Dormibacteraeota bacterium]